MRKEALRPFKILVGLLTLLGALTAWLYRSLPVSDSPAYFQFADQAAQAGIPNFNDVFSNLGFLVAGVYGLLLCMQRSKDRQVWRAAGLILSVGSLLTAAGSAYFHLWPSAGTLFWDRLPMTLIFSAVLAMTVADRIDERLGLYVLAVLVPLGAFSVWGWSTGLLTLRPYLLLQFGGLLFVVLLTALRPQPGRMPNAGLWAAFALYAVAKVFEMADEPIFTFTGGMISGHTLKHLFATLAVYKLIVISSGEKE